MEKEATASAWLYKNGLTVVMWVVGAFMIFYGMFNNSQLQAASVVTRVDALESEMQDRKLNIEKIPVIEQKIDDLARRVDDIDRRDIEEIKSTQKRLEEKMDQLLLRQVGR